MRFIIIPDSFTRTLWQLPLRHLLAKQENLGENGPGILLTKYFVLVGFLACRKILRHGTDSFTSSPKEVVLWIFIALKNPSLAAWFEHVSLESNGKHATIKPQRASKSYNINSVQGKAANSCFGIYIRRLAMKDRMLKTNHY
jgi:hypothetical protein